MSNTKNKSSDIAAGFCKENNYDSFEFHSYWNSKPIYIIEKDKDKDTYIGYPTMLIIDGNITKIANNDEVFAILELTTNEDISKGENL